MEIRREVNKFLKNSSIIYEDAFVKYTEVTRAIKSLKNNKTPGHDNQQLSTILLIIFTNDAPMLKDVEVSLFDDNKLMFTSLHLLRAIVNKLQMARNKCKYCNRQQKDCMEKKIKYSEVFLDFWAKFFCSF